MDERHMDGYRPPADRGHSESARASVAEPGWRDKDAAAGADMADDGPYTAPEGPIVPASAATVYRLKAALAAVSALLVVAVALLGVSRTVRAAPVAAPSTVTVVEATQTQWAVATQTVDAGGVMAMGSFLADPAVGAMLLPAGQQVEASTTGDGQDTFTLASGVVVMLGAQKDAGTSPADMSAAAQRWAKGNQVTLAAGNPDPTPDGLGYANWCTAGTSDAHPGLAGRGCFFPTLSGMAVAWVWSPPDADAAAVAAMLGHFVPVG
ncbi:MAG: hypothetical protein FWF75_10360 [Propionibacteriaceae bacterium]|nr:hypothetical protein [Propionibacteriaceae bacterium]